MDSDFHYYGTGTAALAAGFSKRKSTLIANVAQYVDWFDSDYWSHWRIVDDRGRGVKHRRTRKVYKYKHPQLTIQKINWKMLFDYKKDIWNPFHFPPGNLPHDKSESGWKQTFCEQHVVRRTKLKRRDANKLCRPFSPFALDLITDTVDRYQTLSEASDEQLAGLIDEWVHPRVRCPVTDGRKLALFLLGIRMHILADTWAHQDFTGEQNYAVNSAGFLNEITAQDAKGVFQKTRWTGTVWALRDDTDCAAAPPAPKGRGTLCAGHGQVGHFPDYSWLTFKYPAPWLPKGRRFHIRENPKEYEQAWSWLRFAMGLCSGHIGDEDQPTAPPRDIVRVIRAWHPLSEVGLDAIAKSESRWVKTKLGESIPKRWNPARRAQLGITDGLAVTRFGRINVRRNSILHYMETAAAIHYQFCADWMAANPQYTWKPWRPKT